LGGGGGATNNISGQKALVAALDGWYAQDVSVAQQRPMYDCGSSTMGDLLFLYGKIVHIRDSWVALKHRKVKEVPNSLFGGLLLVSRVLNSINLAHYALTGHTSGRKDHRTGVRYNTRVLLANFAL
jgi:hypothetical protein